MTAQRFEATCSNCGERQEITLEADSPSHVIEAAIRVDERVRCEMDAHGARNVLINTVCTEAGSFPASAPTDEDTIKRAIADCRAKVEAETVARIVAWLKHSRDFALAEQIERGEWKR